MNGNSRLGPWIEVHRAPCRPPLAFALVALALCSTAILASTAAAQIPPYLLQWGSFGTGNGQFQQPTGVAVSSSGLVYVIDAQIPRVQVFTTNGTYVSQWGSEGTGPGQFHIGATGIAVDGSGNVFVADYSRIEKFTSTGTFVMQWGTFGGGSGQFLNRGLALATDASGNVYAGDYGTGRIQKFAGDGTWLATWSIGPVLDAPKVNGLATDSQGNVYVSDNGSFKIRKFSASGLDLGTFPTSLGLPARIAVDPSNHLYAVDFQDHRVVMFNTAGAFLGQWGSLGSGPGQFLNPIGVGTDAFGNVYLADSNNSRMQVFGNPATPALNTSWGEVKRRYR